MKFKPFLIFLIIILVLSGCSSGSDNNEVEINSNNPDPYWSEFFELIENKEFDKARTITKELFKGEELESNLELIDSYQSLEETIQETEKVSNTDITQPKLEIQEGWEWTIDGNYTYITGRVKNMTDTNITYFKLTAEYLDDAGNTLDTDYTNSGETIRPDAMKEFKIMHKHDAEYKKVRIFIDKVNN